MFKILYACLLSMFLIASCQQPAKPQPAIAGVYDTRNGDPESAGTLYVLPDHRFLLTFFGGVAMGTWEIKDTNVVFKPQSKPAGFNFYGRHNKRLGNNTRVFFGGLASGPPAAIGFNPLSKNVQQVFGHGPHRPDFPYIGKFVGIPPGILLAERLIDEAGQTAAGANWRIYTYSNPERYNDFAVDYTPESAHQKSHHFYGTIKNGRLDFAQKSSEKKPFGKTDQKFVEQMLSIPVNPDQVFYGLNYTQVEPGSEKDALNYRFNAQKDAYIKFRSYVEGEENEPVKKDGSNSLNIIYKYQKLKASITSGQVNLNNKPIIKS